MRNVFCLRRNLNLFALSIILGFLLGTYAWSVTDTTFSGKLSVATSWTHSQTGGLTTVTEQLGVLLSQTHTTGTNANQMNAFIQISGTLTNLESRQIDLTAITNTFGQANDLWRVNFLSVQTPSGTFGNLEIGAAGESPFYSIFGGTNHTAIIKPGGMVLFSAPNVVGYTVTNGTFKISNPGPSNATYQVVIGGAQ